MEKALYGLRTSGARWAERLDDEFRKDKWFQSKADPAIWMNLNRITMIILFAG